MAGRVEADHVAGDHVTPEGLQVDRTLRRGPAAVDREPPHDDRSAADEEAGTVEARKIFPIDLDQHDRVPGLAERIRVGGGARLRVPVDRQALRDRRQRRQGDDRVDAASRDVERDRVGAGVGIGVEDRLPQRPRAAVGGRCHREGRGGGREGREAQKGGDDDGSANAHEFLPRRGTRQRASEADTRSAGTPIRPSFGGLGYAPGLPDDPPNVSAGRGNAAPGRDHDAAEGRRGRGSRGGGPALLGRLRRDAQTGAPGARLGRPPRDDEHDGARPRDVPEALPRQSLVRPRPLPFLRDRGPGHAHGPHRRRPAPAAGQTRGGQGEPAAR